MGGYNVILHTLYKAKIIAEPSEMGGYNLLSNISHTMTPKYKKSKEQLA
jgi:hypothetical protein